MLLAGDIGGTKTNLAVFSPEAGARRPVAEATFPSAQYPSLESLAQTFLDRVQLPVESASFGVAGPVVRGEARITNLPWLMSERELGQTLGLSSVRLLNDLEAIGEAVPHLQPEDLRTLNEGHAEPGGTIAIIAPGTGLGEGFLTWDGSRYRSYPSEGGHADFAPNTAFEIGLLRYLQGRLDHVSVERVASGLGIPNIFFYLKDSGYAPEPAWLVEKLASARDPTPIIVAGALERKPACELCLATMRAFVSILGGEAGNLALKVLATGGVYLGGGIPPRILPLLEKGYFTQPFRHKGRLSELLREVPVHVILNPNAALLGAAYHGLCSMPVTARK